MTRLQSKLIICDKDNVSINNRYIKKLKINYEFSLFSKHLQTEVFLCRWTSHEYVPHMTSA